MQSLSDLYNSYISFVTGENGLTCFIIFIFICSYLVGWFSCTVVRLVDDICLYVVPFFKRRIDSLNNKRKTKSNSDNT